MSAKDDIARALTTCERCGEVIVWGELVGGQRKAFNVPRETVYASTDDALPLKHLRKLRVFTEHSPLCKPRTRRKKHGKQT